MACKLNKNQTIQTKKYALRRLIDVIKSSWEQKLEQLLNRIDTDNKKQVRKIEKKKSTRRYHKKLKLKYKRARTHTETHTQLYFQRIK